MLHCEAYSTRQWWGRYCTQTENWTLCLSTMMTAGNTESWTMLYYVAYSATDSVVGKVPDKNKELDLSI